MRSLRIALAVLLVAPALAGAHSHLLSPAPRVPVAGKTPPCDGEPRTGAPLVLAAGQALDVEWTETIDHPGHYRLLFSLAGDTDFQVLLDDIPDRAIPPGETQNFYSATVTLPATPCTECTLQLIQVMTDKPSAPYYYSCADIRLVASATTTSTLLPPAGATTTTLVPCAARPAWERVTCDLDTAAAAPVCAADRHGAVVRQALGLAIGEARGLVADAASAPDGRTARRFLAKAGRRLRAGARRATHVVKLTHACRTSVRRLVKTLRAAVAGLRDA